MNPGSRSQDERTMEEVFTQLEELEETVDSPEERKDVRDVRQALERFPGSQFVTARIDQYTNRDVAEGFVGSVLVSLPLLVEDGVFAIADHFITTTVAGSPVWLIVNVAFVVVLTWGLLYWTEFRELRDRNPIGGLVPRRLVGVLLISLSTVTLMMTMWGRVGGWTDPAVAVARISVVWTAAAFGAGLGDILPGPSSGTDLGDVLGDG